MPRFVAVIFAAVVSLSADSRDRLQGASVAESSPEIEALLTAARGAPPLICAIAARSLNDSWWSGADAPATPLGDARREYGNGLARGPLSGGDLALVLEALDADDACVQELGVRLAARRGGAQAEEAFMARLSSGAAGQRAIAAMGLGLMDTEAAVAPLLGTLRDAEPTVRANAAWALGRIEHGSALQPLTRAMSDASATVRAAAVVAVGQLDSVSSVPALSRILRTDAEASVRRLAAWALGELGSRDGISALAGALRDDREPRVREMSAWALGEIGGRSADGSLHDALRRDADETVRETAAWALGEIGDRGSADVLAAAAADDRSSRVRGTAAWAIGNVAERSGSAPGALLRVLQDESADTRLKAAWALGEVRDPSAAGQIEAALNRETDAHVRRALIRALLLAGGGSRESVSALLSSRDPTVREAAIRGLVGREAFGPWPWPWPRPRPFP